MAKDYFNQLNPKSGELSDDELENVAGGACEKYEDGELIVADNDECDLFICKKCNGTKGEWIREYTYECTGCGGLARCIDCKFVRTKGYCICTHPSKKQKL
jgi:hypothetical protein